MKPLQLGHTTIRHPIILAPMSNVTDLPFRRMASAFGAETTTSEMVACRSLTMQCRKTVARSSKETKSETIVQIVGADPKTMATSAKILEDDGAKIIDINMGCPCRKIASTYAGAALMKDEQLSAQIIRAVVNAVKIPVTIKMRMGWDMQNLNAPQIARLAEELGIQLITIHGRTRAQLYSGTANWSFIRQVKQAVKIPVIVNGDIKDAISIQTALQHSGADGVMIGRATYGKPWLIGNLIKQIFYNETPSNPTGTELSNIVLEHYESMLSYYGIDSGAKQARKHMGWYSAGMKDAAAFRHTINQCTDHKFVIKTIKDFFQTAEPMATLAESGQNTIYP